MTTFLYALSLLSVVMAVLAVRWPERFAIVAHGWRRDKKLCFSTWLMLGGWCFALTCLCDLYALRGWDALTVVIAVLDAVFIPYGLVTLWKLQKPFFLSDFDRLVYELKEQSRGLSPAERRNLHASIRDAAIAELKHLEEEVTREKPENWTELKLRLALQRSLWEEIAERFPEQFPPKLRP